MGRSKQQKIAEVATLPNVFEYEAATGQKWEDYFGNDYPLTLELGCGRGVYTVELARRYPDQNFIGIDLKGARIWKGARAALDEDLRNSAFIRAKIQLLNELFVPKSITGPM